MRIYLVYCNIRMMNAQKQKINYLIMLAKIGNLEPISLVGGSGIAYHFLKSSDSISDVLTDQPSGSWTLLAADTTVIQNSSSPSVDSLLDHIINTSPLYNHLFDQKYVDVRTRRLICKKQKIT